MAIDESNYLNLWDVLVNELIGDPVLAFIVGLILIFLVTIRYKIPEEVVTLFALLWGAAFFAETGLRLIWVMIGLIVGLTFYYMINKKINR